jgi:hypothetical protein
MPGETIASGAQATEEKKEPRRRVGFLISFENDFKLTVLARKKGVDRSTLVNDVIGDLCRGIVISFRGKASKDSEAS